MSNRKGCKKGFIEVDSGRCVAKKDIKLFNPHAGVIDQSAIRMSNIKHFRGSSRNPRVIKGVLPSRVTGVYYDFVALVFNEPSNYGINKGRISKLTIKRKHISPKDRIVYSFDRGRDVETDEGKQAMMKIYEIFPLIDPEDL